MRIFFILFILLLSILPSYSQTPQIVPFQAVLRDSSGKILSGRNISVRITLRDTSSTGIVLYQETQSVTTNSSGQFALNIGGGNVVSGSVPFVGEGWHLRPIYTQIEVDSTGNSNYKNLVLRNYKVGPNPGANFKFR